MVEFLNIDCKDYMRTVPDGFFDLAIVDPPYGINATNMKMGAGSPCRNYKTSTAVKIKGRLNSGGGKLKNRLLNKSLIDWDSEIPNAEYFKELFRVSKNQIIWGGNYFPLPPTRGIIFWDKLQPWENFSQFELAWTSYDKPAAKVAISTTGGANAETKIHPTQKPIKLYQWLYEKYVTTGMKVLDTHLGSGSHAIVAHKKDIDFVGCEINPVYFEDMKTRYYKAIHNPLFGGTNEIKQLSMV